MKRTSPLSEQSETYQRRKNPKFYLIFIIPIYTYLYYKYYYLCSCSPAPQMSITFDHEADILLWTVAKLITIF